MPAILTDFIGSDDELDEVPPDAKARAMERLAHSDFKRILELSNPSLPLYGIDESYEKSDQRHWTLKCGACGTWTALDYAFPTRLGEEVPVIQERRDGSCFRACPKCRSELDVEQGEWVAAYPQRRVHGYRISQLFSSKVDPAEILHEYRTTHFPWCSMPPGRPSGSDSWRYPAGSLGWKSSPTT